MADRSGPRTTRTGERRSTACCRPLLRKHSAGRCDPACGSRLGLYEVHVWAVLLVLEGKMAEASREMDDDLRAYSESQIFGPSPVADYYAVSGDIDTALAWLDRAVRLGDDREEYLRRNPLLAAVRTHPR